MTLPTHGDTASLREQIEAMVVIATGRAVTHDDLRACGGSLEAAGVNSIAYINLIEAIMRIYQVDLDPEQNPDALSTVDGIVELIRAHDGASR